jgi:hypothetical protein
MRYLILVFLLTGGVASADVIRWGNGGSIFGGTTWEVTPDDRVVFSGFLMNGAVTTRPEWVWTNKGMRAGQITFVMAGAFARAEGVVVGLGDPGVAPDFVTDCTDAGQSSVAVDVPGLVYDVSLDNCIAGSGAADGAVKRHYARVLGVQEALQAELGLDGLLGQ